MDGFVHLHVHSHYSLLDGAASTDRLVDRATELGMDALAVTDHGNLFGAVDFYTRATEAGVKPILGMEAYISPTTRQDRSMGNIQTACYHLLLLATDATGWRNLMKLSSRAYLEGFYYKPRIDRELLAELNEGLVCTTACLGGEVPQALLSGQPKRARQILGEYRDIFGTERLFVEVQKQGIAEQDQVNPHLVRLARDMDLGIVASNDVHFLRREDKPAHEVLTCISTGKTLADGGALEYPDEVYLKSAEEMRRAVAAWPEAADNTLKIAEMCDVRLDFDARHLPHFETPEGVSPDEHLRRLAEGGLARRFDGDVPDEYAERLDRELTVIADKGYSSYFLIVNDFVSFARDNGIPSAPRGSGVGTLLGYALRIADVDPLRYGLLFERFTDPARTEAPDLDIDMCQEGRAKVIQYVREKYGHVAQIIAPSMLKARGLIRDVGRVMGMPLPDVDAVARLVPEGPKVTLSSALESEPELRQRHDRDPQVRELIDHGMRLEGLARHAGVHAAGVIIADQPLENIVPLCKQADGEEAITQWDGPTCEKVGLMKMDFLGLRTLSILERCRELVRGRTGEDVDPEALSLDDAKVYELFQEGRTDGVFQFESDGMKGVLMQMRPSCIEDLIAANAMYRPGPMELIGDYCSRKAGREEIPSVHPRVDDILAETYGIMVYQEQVMQVLNRLGGLPLNRALTLIKAISKKKEKTVAEERPNFIAGAQTNGISEREANELFDLILKFAGYGFNKSHSARYAILAYQTAWFKVQHPREFLAATLTYESVDTDKVVQYMAEAARMGVEIAPPDINTCDSRFTVDGERVRFGLAAVRGVGGKAIDAIVAAREEVGQFKDLYHFCRHVDLRAVNRATVEALIKCGAFDALGAHRAAMTAALDQAIALGQSAAEDRRSGQMSFFGEGGVAPAATEAPRFPDVEPWSETQLLAAEKETLGFFISSHPLVKYARELDSLSQPDGIDLASVEQQPEGAPVTIGCMIASVRHTVTRRKQERMAMLTLEDTTGKADAVCFPRTFEQYGELLTDEAMVFVTGTIDRRRERANILVDEVVPIDEALAKLTAAVELRLAPNVADDAGTLGALRELLAEHTGGACPVYFRLTPQGRPDVTVLVRGGEGCTVAPSRKLVAAVEDLLGDDALALRPRKAAPANGGGNGRNGYARRNGTGGTGSRSAGGRSGAPMPVRSRHSSADGPASEAVTRFD